MAELLLVDNDEDIRSLLSLGLREAGHTIREASNGLEALRAIEISVPDILITDLIMPTIPGDKLLKILKAVPDWKSIPTIVISGVAVESPETRDEVPCDVYIAKGPMAQTLNYIVDSVERFERTSTLATPQTLGLDSVHSRHITRELLEINHIQQKVLDTISEGLCIMTKDGLLVWINATLARTLSRPEERILGRSITEFLPDIEKTELISGTTGSTAEFELPRSGGIVRVEVLEPTVGAPEIVLIWRNVTDRLLNEEQFENIVESTSDVILTTDLEGYVTYVTETCIELTGVARDQLIGRPIWRTAPRDIRERIKRIALQLAPSNSEDKPQTDDVWPFIHADGTVRSANVRTSKLRNRAERTIGLRWVLADITARLRLEKERDALLHELHHRVRDNLQLIASLARLSEPELLEGRVAAVSYVFDELYETENFSEISTAQLVERVVASAISFSRCEHMPNLHKNIAIRRIGMRLAVPLAIIIQETTTGVVRGILSDVPCLSDLYVDLYPTEIGYSLRVSLSTDAFNGQARAVDKQELLAITAAQLRGECTMFTTADETCYEVAFPPDALESRSER